MTLNAYYCNDFQLICSAGWLRFQPNFVVYHLSHSCCSGVDESIDEPLFGSISSSKGTPELA
jgi:hypothetical protein